MSDGKSVIVLTPNGRRQTVKVTPNTTILQVLEEVCLKHGFQPEEYDIKHHRHILDLSSVIRFSGLPNNAQLEMTPTAKLRKESDVTVALQLESGNRYTGSFLPSDNLWDIVQKLCPEGTDISTNPVVIYMRAEVVGVQKLKQTTLRLLGITTGRAMLRLVHRTLEELKHQANISTPLQPKPVEVVTRKMHQNRDLQSEQSKLTPTLLVHDSEPSRTVEFTSTGSMQVDGEELIGSTAINEKEGTIEEIMTEPQECSEIETINVDANENMEVDVPCNSGAPSNVVNYEDPGPEPIEEEVILLGDRNAIAFNSACVQCAVYDDLPDDFFELTVEDARILLRDIKRQRTELEDNPITTSAMRELEASKQVLNDLNRYKKSVIRVHFPDQLVLQGTFTPHETVGALTQFVRSFLRDPEMQFYVFTAPPKKLLSEDVHLVEAGLVPNAVVHFGTEMPRAGDGSYLKSDIMDQLSSPAAALNAASRCRGLSHIAQHHTTAYEERPSTSGPQSQVTKENPVPKPSQKTASFSPSASMNKIPKWFKPSK